MAFRARRVGVGKICVERWAELKGTSRKRTPQARVTWRIWAATRLVMMGERGKHRADNVKFPARSTRRSATCNCKLTVVIRCSPIVSPLSNDYPVPIMCILTEGILTSRPSTTQQGSADGVDTFDMCTPPAPCVPIVCTQRRPSTKFTSQTPGVSVEPPHIPAKPRTSS